MPLKKKLNKILLNNLKLKPSLSCNYLMGNYCIMKHLKIIKIPLKSFKQLHRALCLVRKKKHVLLVTKQKQNFKTAKVVMYCEISDIACLDTKINLLLNDKGEPYSTTDNKLFRCSLPITLAVLVLWYLLFFVCFFLCQLWIGEIKFFYFLFFMYNRLNNGLTLELNYKPIITEASELPIDRQNCTQHTCKDLLYALSHYLLDYLKAAPS